MSAQDVFEARERLRLMSEVTQRRAQVAAAQASVASTTGLIQQIARGIGAANTSNTRLNVALNLVSVALDQGARQISRATSDIEVRKLELSQAEGLLKLYSRNVL